MVIKNPCGLDDKWRKLKAGNYLGMLYSFRLSEERVQKTLGLSNEGAEVEGMGGT